jgi:hypothetical protein
VQKSPVSAPSMMLCTVQRVAQVRAHLGYGHVTDLSHFLYDVHRANFYTVKIGQQIHTLFTITVYICINITPTIACPSL